MGADGLSELTESRFLDASRSTYDRLLNLISTRAAQVGVIGLGYVGLPLAVAIARVGFPVSGFDIEAQKVESLNNGQSYIEAVTSTALAGQVASGRFRGTADFAELAVCDVIIICVPTPLTKNREPDLSFVRNTAGTVAKHLRLGQLIVLESTTYPGTTDDVIKPILEETGLQSNIDFFLGFSPEREDPGNRSFEVATIPKVVAGDGIEAAILVQAFYQGVVKTVVPVSTTATAEAVKLTENIFRSVNIALVNELKVVLGAMGIDIWEVIEAAKSKPFGYMPFYPGPGLGGHCVPIDPFYLTWKARDTKCRPASSSWRQRSTRPCRVMWSMNWRRRWTSAAARRSAARAFSSSGSPTRRMCPTSAKAPHCGSLNSSRNGAARRNFTIRMLPRSRPHGSI